MKGETEKETEHPNYKLQRELTLLSLKVFTAVGVSFVLRPEETDGT